MAKVAECPVCGAEIKFDDDTVIGELLVCVDCGSELEVVSINPPLVNEAPQEEEDWGQ